MKRLSFYDPVTGLLSRQQLIGPDSMDVALHTPAGLAAIDGHHDWRTRRVNLGTLQVEDCEPPAPDAREAAVAVRFDRAHRLVAADLQLLRALERNDGTAAAWIGYRQALRDVPEQPGFPFAVDWPTPP